MMRAAHLVLTAAAAVSGLALVSPAPALPAGVAEPVERNLTATTLDLGTLGGRHSVAMAVDGDVVVGGAETASGERHAFAYDLAAAEPAMLDLGTLGGGFSEAVDVDGTIVVGTSVTASGERRAFAYDLGVAEPAMIDLGTLGGGFSEAVDVDGTIVVGTSDTAGYSDSPHAFAYDLAAAEPAMLDLGTLGGGFSEAAAVDGAIVVGRSGIASGAWHAFAYDLGAAEPAMLDLGTLGAVGGWHPDLSEAVDVDRSIVVGGADTASGEGHAFAYDLGAAEPAMLDLGVSGQAMALDGTVVVGSSHQGSHGVHAFAYDLAAPEPAVRDLGTVGGASTRATAIDGDHVIGSWSKQQRAFAVDLGSDDPRILGLGSWRGSTAGDVDGDVVVGVRTANDLTQRATAWVLHETTRPMIAIRRLNHRVKEDVGRATIRVTRYGRTDRAVTVRYRTRSVKAKAGEDFEATSGTLRFARGVTHRRFTVKILDDRRREGQEFLLLTLSRPSSPALLGTPSLSYLRITTSDR